METKKIKNVRELTEDLTNVYHLVRTQQMTSRDANDLANVAGKILNAAKSELQYRQWRKERVKIPFFECDVQPEDE